MNETTTPELYCNKVRLQTFIKPLWWQEKGLSYTASGYGRKIPTQYMVYHEKRLKRVYCCIFSNVGTLFIVSKGKELTIRDY